MAKFRDFSAKKYGITFNDWLVNPDTAGDFWMALFEFLDIRVTKQPSRAFEPVRRVAYDFGGPC
jgi:acetoacetyl-CoA synthetase